MSQENADVVRQQFRALERDLDAVSAFWHPEIEWRAIEGAADDVGVMNGHNALRRYYEDWVSTFDQLRAEVDEVLFDADDRVAVSVRNSGRGRVSGVVTEGRYYVACTVRDGQIVRGREYETRDQALKAVGVRETAMSQENVEIVRRAWEFEMFGRTGSGDPLADFAHDFVMNPVEEEPSYGRAAIRDNFRRFETAWEKLEVEAEEFIDAGEQVFVAVHFWGTGRASGVPVDARLYEVYTLRDRSIVRVDEFTDRKAALEAAGLDE